MRAAASAATVVRRRIRGLSTGAEVVLFGQSKLSDGLPIRVIAPEEEA